MSTQPEQSQNPDDVARGAVLSAHAHPYPLLYRLNTLLMSLGLGGIAFGAVGLVVFGLWYELYLLPLMALFLLALAVPLVQLAALHPQITVYERGLWLQPMLGRGAWVPWDAVRDVTDHTLIHRVEDKRGRLERDGRLVVVESGLPWLFQAVGGMAGLGWRTRAFGIATHAHTDYKTLLNAIQHHKPHD